MTRITKQKISSIVYKYNHSNYFHVGPRRELMKIALDLESQNENLKNRLASALDESANTQNKLNDVEDELFESNNELYDTHNYLQVTMAGLNHSQSVLDDIQHVIDSGKKRKREEMEMRVQLKETVVRDEG